MTAPARPPRRVQLRRTKGWRKPEGVVVVSRPSRWGNPFRVGDEMMPPRLGQCPSVRIDQKLAVELFRAHVERFAAEFDDYAHGSDGHDLAELAGRDLACWCPLDEPCHADVLLELANRATS
ncbi:DUF4326 domain-containing protein [Georgenia sp. MJ206]|uniref:DUF4326 domain-containing protein n=1 Tax=Georgenia wangjunii TaxID=3117730 RepID=UPI002F25F684